MKLDFLVEAICLAVGDVYFEDTRIKSITVHPPTPNSQLLTLTDHDGDNFSIEVKILRDNEQEKV